MKLKIITPLLFILLISYVASSQEPIVDFRGIEWGTTISELQSQKENVRLISQGDRYARYMIDSDDKNMGTAELTKIAYFFDEELKFAKVAFEGEPRYSEDMHSLLSTRLGRPDDVNIGDVSAVRIWDRPESLVIFREYTLRDFTVEITSKRRFINKQELNKNIDDF